jgi:site-specific recombinase
MTKSALRTTLEAIAGYGGTEVDLLAQLVQAVRPTRKQRARREVPQVDALIALLTADPILQVGLSTYVARLVQGKRFNRILIDQGMPGTAFWHELRQRITYKLLPYQPERNTVDHVLANVFYREGDGDWLGHVDDERAIRLMELLNGKGADQWKLDEEPLKELLFTTKVLGLRISGKAFDSGVLRMVPEYENLENPFVALGDALDDHIDGLLDGTVSRLVSEESYRHLRVLIGHCEGMIERAYRNSSKLGMGFQVNQHLIQMSRMLERLQVTLSTIAIDPATDPRKATVDLVKNLVQFNSGSTRVLGFIDRSTQVMAREITHHTGQAGERYITTTTKEYAQMFTTALGGGAVVAVACILKAWFGTWDVSLVGHAALYSFNYAWAFITIYLLHLTLATKQPAMTAATIAATLDQGRSKRRDEQYDALAALLSRVWRSQFVAFLGNVLMAFPVAMALAYGWNALFGHAMLEHKSAKLLGELDPFLSLAIPHAAIAGVFLFISGLISGSIVNKTIHRRIPERIAQHPVLKLTLSENARTRLAGFYERHAGGILSNFWFGVFMGSIGTVGVIFGLPLDIRHITFAAGNMGLGLVGAGWAVDAYTVVVSLIGIGLIGFVNFIVSFGLSLALALRSRNVPIIELVDIAKALWQRFMRAPWSFFFPPKSEKVVVAIKEPTEVV